MILKKTIKVNNDSSLFEEKETMEEQCMLAVLITAPEERYNIAMGVNRWNKTRATLVTYSR